MLGGMVMPVEFENELERWLDGRLDERLVAERKTMLEMVIKLVAFLFDEQIQRDGAARAKELEQLSEKIQTSFDRVEAVLERQAACIDRAVRGEALDRMN
jgi:hypothetical protein